jgi:hypothetical protein
LLRSLEGWPRVRGGEGKREGVVEEGEEEEVEEEGK